MCIIVTTVLIKATFLTLYCVYGFEANKMPFEAGKGQQKTDEATIAGPSNYNPNSPPTVTLSELVAIDNENQADAQAVNSNDSDRFGAEVTSVNGNVATVELYNTSSADGDGATAALDADDSGADVSDTQIRVQGRGF